MWATLLHCPAGLVTFDSTNLLSTLSLAHSSQMSAYRMEACRAHGLLP